MAHAFARANAMMRQIAVIIAQHGVNRFAAQAELKQLAPYESRGKRSTKLHNHGGTASAQRAARKARNVKANRRAHRG